MPSDNTLHGGYEYYSYEHEWKIDEKWDEGQALK